MLEPRLGVDDFENANALKVLDRAIAGERSLDRVPIDDPVCRQPPSENALADPDAKMVEQPRCEPARGSLHTAVADGGRKLTLKRAAGKSPVATAGPPFPARHAQAFFHDWLRHEGTEHGQAVATAGLEIGLDSKDRGNVRGLSRKGISRRVEPGMVKVAWTAGCKKCRAQKQRVWLDAMGGPPTRQIPRLGQGSEDIAAGLPANVGERMEHP